MSSRPPLLALMLLASWNVALPAVAAQRPNIVVLMCDDMGFSDIGCYGGEIDTPNLDRLAAEGMRFRTFYNNAKCEHTRASLLTGHWWHHIGASPDVHYAAPTFGERLQATRYRTLMTGKWHAGQTPYQRGFHRYYGLTDGCCNFWNPGHAREGEPEPARKRIRRWAIDGRQFHPYTPQQADFYTTDAFTDWALDYLEDAQAAAGPFLLYVAYTAPHYPLHASEQDVAKYRGRYRAIGWDRLRDQRFARQQRLGVLPPGVQLSPRDPKGTPWDAVAEQDRDQWDLKMATYAAMIDRMDRNIGRILSKLDELGVRENTVIFFLSDNGACADSRDLSSEPDSLPWEVTSYLKQGLEWANASNTPFRKFKTTDYEGGTRTPMIAAWPGVIRAGSITDQVGHVIDFVPTLLDLAGTTAPESLPGHSLVPVLEGNPAPRPWPLYWQFNQAKAIRDRQWKLVKFEPEDWELYDLSADPSELINLAAQDPQRVKSMARQWQTWWRAESPVSPPPDPGR